MCVLVDFFPIHKIFSVASHDGDKKVEYKNEEGLIIAQ
jgi:hypothetical protein